MGFKEFGEHFIPKKSFKIDDLFKDRQTGKLYTEKDIYDYFPGTIAKEGSLFDPLIDEDRFEQVGLRAIPRGVHYFPLGKPYEDFFIFGKGPEGEVRKQS